MSDLIVPIQLSLSNAFLITGKHPILVDTGSPGDGPNLLAALEKFGATPTDLALVVQTHAHFDHCGNTHLLKQLNPALPVLAHAADVPLMKKGQNQVIRPGRWLGHLAKPFLNRPFEAFIPDLVIEGPINLSAFECAAMVVPTPGHTSGSLSIVFDRGDAIVGDLMAGNLFRPRCADYHIFIDDKSANNRSIKYVIELGAQRFFVGHGGPFPLRSVFQRLDKKCFY